MIQAFIRRSGPFALLAFGAIHAGWAVDGKVARQGFDLYYRKEGTGIPIVFISGGPGFDVDYMKEVGSYFPSGYQRNYLEQRGTGRSMPSELSATTVSVSLWIEDIEAMRVALNQEKLFIIAHPGGGLLAQAYAAAHPDRVGRMILIGSGGPTLEFAPTFLDNLNSRQRPEDLRLVAYWDAAERKVVDHEKASNQRVRAVTPAYFYDRNQGIKWAAAQPDGSFHAQTNELIFADLAKGYDARPGLRKLNCPVLIIQGHQDPIGDLTALEIHNTTVGSSLVFLGKCGHYPWVEQPTAFKDAVLTFLNASNRHRILKAKLAPDFCQSQSQKLKSLQPQNR